MCGWPKASHGCVWLGHNPRHDVHRHQLLKQQLTRVWYVNLRDGAALALGRRAAEILLGQIRHRDEATVLTDVDAVGVRVLEKAVEEEG